MFGVFAGALARVRPVVRGRGLRLPGLAAAISTALALIALAAPGVGFATPSTNADLSSLSMTGVTLSPSFDAATTSYTSTVDTATASVMVTAVTADSNATITVDVVNPATSGVAYGPVSLNYGTTTIGVQVTAQDGVTTKTYQVTIDRPLPGGGGGGASTNADLSGLTLSAGTLSPAFSAGNGSYTASVPNATSSITVTPTLADLTASMTVNGSPATSGAASGAISLNVGANSITIVTTAQDGVTTKSYAVTITRAAPSLTAQTITFNNPGGQNFGTTPTFTATSDSGLPISFSSSTTGVCTITSGGAVTFLTVGNCTINADQAGNATYAAATTVSRTVTVFPVAPGAPTTGAITVGDTQASVAFTAPAFTGGDTITGYTATSNPGGLTGTCAASPCLVTGLTNGTAYTFTVTATNSAGTGAASSASSSATPKASQTITFANPGAQNFGTTPTLTATSDSSLTVAFSSSTTAVCTITSGGALTFVAAGTCTINADQAGNGSFLAAGTVTQSFAVNAVVPGAPTIGAVTPGNGQASVAFTAPASNGGAAITGYTVTSSPGGFTASCASSPCVLTGLTNGTGYTFTVTATNSAGTGPASSASASATPAAPSTDATLAGLTLSSGTLSPAFAGGTTSYTASVANGVTSITVTPTVNESHATVKVNGNTVTSGSASGAVALNVGSNTVTVLVTAQDGTTTKTYTATVTRAAAPPPPALSSNANLSGLEMVSGNGAATEVRLDPNTTAYRIEPNPGGFIYINAFAADSTAQVKINGVRANGGYKGGPYTLSAGDNVFTIVVTAQDGTTTKTYTLTIGPPPRADNADLSAVQICTTGAGAFCSSPSFDPATTTYTIQAVGQLQIKPTTADPGATVTVNGASVASGSVSAVFSAPSGAITPVPVAVTSRDKSVTKTYTFSFGIPKPSADLSALGVSAGTLYPAFDPATVSYSLFVSGASPTVTLTPTAKDPGAAVAMGNLDTSAGISGPISVSASSVRVGVVVTATDKTTKRYYVNVSRPAPLDVFPSSSPAAKVGSPWSASYFVRYAHPIVWTSTDLPPGLTLTKVESSLFEPAANISGTPTKAGTYTFTLTATAANGETSGSITQTLTVADATSGGSTAADLARLNLYTMGEALLVLTPAFDPAVTDYTATTDAHALAPLACPTADPFASCSSTGPSPYDNGWQLAVGRNVFQFAITARDGTHKTYTVTVIRTASSNADLKSLTFGYAGATLSPSFDPATTSYTLTLPEGVEADFMPFKALSSDPEAEITAPGALYSLGSSSGVANMSSGSIPIQVTAPDGSTTKTYTVTVKQVAPLTLSSDVLSATNGVAFSQKLSASGGTAPYVFEADRLAGGEDVPAGLTLKSDGTVSGTPTGVGIHNFGVKVTDSKGATGTGLIEMIIGSSVPTGSISGANVPVPVGGTTTISLSGFQPGAGVTFTLVGENAAGASLASPLAARASTVSAKTPGGSAAITSGQAAAGVSVLVYTPKAGFMGVDHLLVIAHYPDGSQKAMALDFQVAGQAPDLTAKVAANGLVRLDPTASRTGGPFMGLKILSPPAYGQVSVSGLQLFYTPDPRRLGPASFVYAVDLGFGLSAPGTVTVTTGQAVSAPSLTASAYAGQKVSLDLTSGAQGGPFTGASVVSISPSTAGTAAIRATGTGTYALDFTPATSFAGPAKVTYTLSGSGGADIADATITVLARPDPSLNADLRGLISASDQAVKTFARTQTDNFNGRLESLRSGRGRGGFDMKVGFAAPSSGEDPRDQAGWRTRRLARQGAPDPTGQAPAAPRVTDAPSAAPGASLGKPSAFGTWVAGTIQIGHVDGTTRRRDYRLSTSGLSAGVDYRLSDHLVLGAGLGYGEDKAKVGSKGSRLDGESKVGAAYGSWLPRPGVFVDGVLGYGKLSFDVTRYSAEADKLLTGSRSGDMTFGSLRAGYEGQRGDLRFSPYGQVSFLHGRLDSFTEAGDAVFALRYEGQDVRSLASTLGLKLEGLRKLGRDRSLAPRVRVEWRHEFDGVGDQALSYADWAGSPRYVVRGDRLGRDEGSVELGGRLTLEHQFAIDLGYRAMFSNSMHSDSWTLRLDHSF